MFFVRATLVGLVDWVILFKTFNLLLQVCTCPSGYRGDPLVACRRGECEHDEDCSSSQGCYNFRCEDPCRRDSCGISADCRPRNHGNREGEHILSDRI